MIRFIQCLLIFAATNLFATEDKWYQVNTDLYTVDFPSEPTKSVEKESMVTNTEYRLEQSDNIYVTSHFKIPKAAFAPFVGYSLEGFANKVLSSMIERDDQFKKMLYKTVKKNKRQVLLEYSYEKKNGRIMTGNLMISHGNFYQLSTNYPEGDQGNKNFKQFASTFQLKNGFSIPRTKP
ncbi:MAG: hypothetical protein P0S96_08535 [Simkaniaceae bacterium]|nr:hypothetical protein [Candidatus Sacchlamyda saccharinae]